MKQIKKIKINKLFGRYNNELDLSSRAIIFIGENGVGKTTTMKILQNLMNLDFKELIKYDFESIDLETTTKSGRLLHETLNYEDLLPSVEEITKNFKKSSFYLDDLYRSWDGYCEGLPDEEVIEYYNESYPSDDEDPISDEDKVSDFQSNECEYFHENGYFVLLSDEIFEDLIKKKELKNIIRKIIKDEEFNDLFYKNYIDGLKDIYNERTNSYVFSANYCTYFDTDYESYGYSEIKDTLNAIIDSIKEYFEITKKDIYFENKAKIKKILTLINNNINKKIEILDMTQLYVFENKLVETSLIRNKLLEWKSSMPIGYNDIFEDTEQKIYETVLEQIDGKDFFNNWWGRYERNIYFYIESKDISAINDKIIEINNLINHYFYNEQFLAEINSTLLAYYVVSKNHDWKLNNEKKAETDLTHIKDRFIKYIRPILLRYCPFDVDWGIMENSSSLYNVFCDFYTKEWKTFEENINPKMKILQSLMSKYMMNKIVEITPMGILIKSKENNRNIPLNSLSSGEKKLLIIFLHCLYNEDVPILIDEPEISLSIIWQENLLPDLLQKTPIKQIIVATHSSAIISSSMLDDYIVPLPNSIINQEEDNNNK